MIFSKKDLRQIEKKGLTVEKIHAQLETFEEGLSFINLVDAATIGNGILALSEDEKEHYIKAFERSQNDLTLVKFVPASGAATRMFKFLFEFLEHYHLDTETIEDYIKRNQAKNLDLFFSNLKCFPFYAELEQKLNKVSSNDKDLVDVIKVLLDVNQLNWSALPKGLLPFHSYENHTASAFEEHLLEAANYASSNGKANLHFTVSKEHIEKFQEQLNSKEGKIQGETETRFDIVFSTQKETTDSIAVNSDNSPFRTEDGNLLFRPSGHGALINNLNTVSADIVFIKNIDNVVTIKYVEVIGAYKKLLAGILLDLQKQTFRYLNLLEKDQLDEALLVEVIEFLSKKMNETVDTEIIHASFSDKKQYVFEKLNRPIRVCGMVKNEGEPGGGPFWVSNENANVSLQIVESAQVDMSNTEQNNILQKATHFNPVDLVCGLKNYKGEKFNLNKFVDANATFISEKTYSGKPLKALELPGLWNGSMADWNTIFVEVPLATFNPVKTVNDLLKPQHQNT